MSIRVKRENMYVPLPMGVGHILAMKDQKNYALPIDEVNLSPFGLLALLRVRRGWMKGLVIQVGEEADEGASKWNNYARYSVDCRLAGNQLHLGNIEGLDFRLEWVDGEFLPEAIVKSTEK